MKLLVSITGISCVVATCGILYSNEYGHKSKYELVDVFAIPHGKQEQVIIEQDYILLRNDKVIMHNDKAIDEVVTLSHNGVYKVIKKLK